MKKSKKGFILLGITTSIIAANGIMQAVSPLKLNLKEKNVLNYNHNPASALDNVFIEDNMTILPFIFSNSSEVMTKPRIEEEFRKAGLTIKNISTGDIVGTGTEITVNENSNTYTVLIYGDVDGDGEIGFYDALDVIWAVNNPEAEKFKGIFFKAANLENNDNEIEFYDALRVISFVNEVKGAKILLNEPTSIKENRQLTAISIEYDNSTPVSAATTIDQIKANMVVKAHYDNGDIENVDSFEITGNLIAGQDNTLTVSALGKTENVTVSVAERELESITAEYNDETPVPVTTKLSELKSNITVTGKYNDGTTGEITEFELKGDLLPGQTNVITVTVQNKEATINVTVDDNEVDTIQIESLPTKVKYDYGEETLDLTGGKIKVNWVVGEPSSIEITNGMISGYDPKQEGPQTLTVTYGGATDTFEITVKDRISALEIVSAGRTDDVTVVSDRTYRVESKSANEFNLGTIQAVNKDNVSALNPNDITLEVELNSSDDSDATSDSIKVEKVVDENNNVTIKGKVEHSGVYTVNAVLSYEDKTVRLPITVQAIKNLEISMIKFNMEKDDLRVGKPLRINIDGVMNIHGEKITPDSIAFENKTEGLEISMFDSTGTLIEGTDLSRLAYIEVSTTIENAQTANFTIKATTSKNSKTALVTLSVKDAPVVSSIELSKSIAPLYIEDKEDTVTDENGNIYTVIDVKFIDQYGEQMDVAASNLTQITEPLDASTLGLTKNQIVLVRPKVTVQRKNSDKTLETNGLYTKLYDAEGNEASGNTSVSKIGVAIITDSPNFDVVLSSIDGKNLKFANYQGTTIGTEIPLQVVYKDLTTIRITEEGQENVVKGANGIYNVPLNEEFILGTITVGANEGPLTADMLSIQDPKEGLTISYELKDGKIIVKGTVTQAGTYSVRPITTEGLLAKNSMNIKAEATPTVSDINLSSSNVEIGRATESELTVVTDLNPTGQEITAGDIKVEADADIVVTLLNEDRDPIEDGQLLQKVKYLKLEAKEVTQNDNDNVNLTITVFEGKTNAKTVSKTIKVYQPVPRAIEVDNTITLYGSENENTITGTADGLNYTLVPIKAWADAEKTKPVVLTAEMFDEYVDNMISVTIPKVKIKRNDKEISYDLIANKLFDVNKYEVNSGDIEYIGFAKKNLPSGAVMVEGALDGVAMTITCLAENGQTATITTSYSEN